MCFQWYVLKVLLPKTRQGPAIRMSQYKWEKRRNVQKPFPKNSTLNGTRSFHSNVTTRVTGSRCGSGTRTTTSRRGWGRSWPERVTTFLARPSLRSEPCLARWMCGITWRRDPTDHQCQDPSDCRSVSRSKEKNRSVILKDPAICLGFNKMLHEIIVLN